MYANLCLHTPETGLFALFYLPIMSQNVLLGVIFSKFV